MNNKIVALVFLVLIISPASAHKVYVRRPAINEQEKERVYECLRNQLSGAVLTGTFTTFSSFILAKMGLWMAGFSSLGPVAGSLAAWLQSTIGNVAAGSIFAYLQSLAMGQLTLLVGPTVVAGAITGIIYLMFSCIKISMLVEEKEVNEEQQQNTWGQTFSNFYNNYIGNNYEILAALTNARDFLYDVIKFIVYFIQQEYLKFQKPTN